MRNNILIIDDDIDLCTVLARFLMKNGYETDIAHTGYKGIARFTEKKFDVVICDYRLGDMEGKDVVSALKKINQHVIILVITGYSDIKTAVEVIKLGALDYITKPLIPDEVLNVLNKALQHTENNGANAIKKIPIALNGTNNNKPSASRLAKFSDEFFLGRSPAAEALYAQVDIVAATNYSIILYGESGTGKEVIAKTIHSISDRRDKPFVAMDCGTLSKELSGSELFGHVKGAFTGALQDKEGHFELADGGTLFLDEVGNLSPEVQATLLRVIQERKFKKVGGNKEIQVDVRIIVASNENLQEAYRKGKFREDLYHRFNEFSISLPPLRSRKDDIQLFADFFLKKTTEELNKEVAGFENDVMQTFLQYSWPGNLREFRNVVRRAVLLTEAGKKITSASLPWEITNSRPFSELNEETPLQPIQKPNKEEINLKEAATKAEFDTIMTVLQQVNFNKKRAAELLKIDRKTLYNKIKNYQL
jgi:two-component system, NtrC family, response regulator HydG